MGFLLLVLLSVSSLGLCRGGAIQAKPAPAAPPMSAAVPAAESVYSSDTRVDFSDMPTIKDLEKSAASSYGSIGSSYNSYASNVADSGPADIGHEIHAKMEEAAEHALTIINGAYKFVEEAENEQQQASGKADMMSLSVNAAPDDAKRYKRHAVQEVADKLRRYADYIDAQSLHLHE